EKCEAPSVEPSSAKEARDSANSHQQYCDGEHVDCYDQDANVDVCVKIIDDCRKPIYYDAGVEGRHENSDGCNSEHDPLVIHVGALVIPENPIRIQRLI